VRQSGQRIGSKVRTVAVGQAFHPAGFNGFDGLVRITTDGVLHIHSGVGNLGTYSYASTSRVAAEVLKCDWERCVVERGDSRKGLPFNSNTSFTMTRTNYVAATDALRKLKQIAARDFSGAVSDYDVDGARVFRMDDPSVGMSYRMRGYLTTIEPVSPGCHTTLRPESVVKLFCPRVVASHDPSTPLDTWIHHRVFA